MSEIFSARLDLLQGPHARVSIFNRGGLSGQLCIEREDVRDLLRRVEQQTMREAFLDFLADNEVEYTGDGSCEEYTVRAAVMTLDNLARACGFTTALDALDELEAKGGE
jgi:hypothetical protein